MDLNRLTRDADDLIRKVVARYNQLYIPTGQISQLELDLMLDDMRRLYDTFKAIGHINLSLQASPPKPEVTVTQTHTSPETITQEKTEKSAASTQTAPLIQKEERIEKTAITSTEKYTAVEPEEELLEEPIAAVNTVHETVETGSNEIEMVFTEPAPAVEEKTPEVKNDSYSVPVIEETKTIVTDEPEVTKTEETTTGTAQNEPAPATLADRFSSAGKSLSDTIASQQAQNVMASRLMLQPISDLSTGIGLNDKFTFISELFANNPGTYDEAIMRMNKAVNIDEAGWILQKYHTAEWDQKQESLNRLKDFVKRRFL